MKQRFNLQAFMRLVRFPNLLIIGLTQYFLKIFLIDDTLALAANFADVRLFILSSCTILIAAAGYIINDYYDVKIDTVNKPERVVVGRLVSRRVAMLANLVLNFLALGLALWLGWRVFVVCLACAVLLWLYSNRLKREPLVGNLAIAALTGMTVGLLAIYYRHHEDFIWIFAMFAFFITLIREIVKDMEDVRGDATFGCRTLPIVWGIPRTKHVIYVFFGIFVVILLSTYLTFPSHFVAYLAVVVLPPLAYFLYRLVRADRRRDFAFLSQLSKLIMLLGVLSMAWL